MLDRYVLVYTGISYDILVYIGAQPRADFFKSLHESAKSASGELFTDFLQTFFADHLL
jgi:hypothetical protein